MGADMPVITLGYISQLEQLTQCFDMDITEFKEHQVQAVPGIQDIAG